MYIYIYIYVYIYIYIYPRRCCCRRPFRAIEPRQIRHHRVSPTFNDQSRRCPRKDVRPWIQRPKDLPSASFGSPKYLYSKHCTATCSLLLFCCVVFNYFIFRCLCYFSRRVDRISVTKVSVDSSRARVGSKSGLSIVLERISIVTVHYEYMTLAQKTCVLREPLLFTFEPL